MLNILAQNAVNSDWFSEYVASASLIPGGFELRVSYFGLTIAAICGFFLVKLMFRKSNS
jgi:hypothetical protein